MCIRDRATPHAQETEETRAIVTAPREVEVDVATAALTGGSQIKYKIQRRYSGCSSWVDNGSVMNGVCSQGTEIRVLYYEPYSAGYAYKVETRWLSPWSHLEYIKCPSAVTSPGNPPCYQW